MIPTLTVSRYQSFQVMGKGESPINSFLLSDARPCAHRQRFPSQIYSFDPSANLTSEQHKLVLGGETLLWTEQADSTNLDHLIWYVQHVV